MAEKRYFIIVLLLLLIMARYSLAEIIDGPANVRNTPRGTILFELNDYVEVYKENCSGEWCSITLRVEVSKDAMEGNKIKANQILKKYLQNTTIGKTINAVTLKNPDLHMSGKVTGLISGITHIKNFRTSISTDVKKLFELAPGYYVTTDIVDEKQKQYWPGRFWHSPQIFSELEIRREGSSLIFKAGNFHEQLLDFVLHESGLVEGNICFEQFCIKKIEPIDKKTFKIDISGKKPITLISTVGLQEMYDPDDETQ